MGSVKIIQRLSLFAMAFLFAASLLALGSSITKVSATDTGSGIDEIHAQFGNDASSSMWILWRGPAAQVYYGTTTAYGSTSATSTASSVTPMDTSGPFMRVQLTGLTAYTEYHYKIGVNGDDHTFKTAPGRNDDFSWIDLGDTGTTYGSSNIDQGYAITDPNCNSPWMSDVWTQIATENPDFLFHGGDITYANDCGPGAIHQFYQDIAPIAGKRAFMQVWGNHEYGPIQGTSTTDPTTALMLWDQLSPGITNDTYLNYKGRNVVPNPQTLTNSGGNQGCNGACVGSDYGSFTAGGVLFLMLPENHYQAYGDATLTSGWAAYADAKMANAQSDPNIDMVITVAHQPAYTSLSDVAQNDLLLPVLNALGDKYAPSSTGPYGGSGKYVLNVNHHIHGMEVFSPQHGVWQITSGAGGIERAGYPASGKDGSLYMQRNPGYLKIRKQGKVLHANLICGPAFKGEALCNQGEELLSPEIQIEVKPYEQPAPATACSAFPTLTGTEYVENRSIEDPNAGAAGWLDTYTQQSQISVDTFNACDGYRSVKVGVKPGQTPTSTIGFVSDAPHWVSAGTSTQTVAGENYVGSVYVKPTEVGKTITLAIKEETPAGGNALTRTAVLTPTTTGWQPITAPTLTAVNTGDSLVFKLYEATTSASSVFYADQMSIVKLDGSGQTPQTLCSDSLTTNQLVTNRSVESDRVGWASIDGSEVSNVSRTNSDACDGVTALKVSAIVPPWHETLVPHMIGFQNSPQYVDGSNVATVQGAVYTASVWVKGVSGSSAMIELTEVKANGTTAGSNRASIILDGSWQRLSVDYTSVLSGNKLKYEVTASNSVLQNTPVGDLFADNMSLTYENAVTLNPVYTCSHKPNSNEALSNPSFEESDANWKNYGGSPVTMSRSSSNVCEGVYGMRVKYQNQGNHFGAIASDTAPVSKTTRTTVDLTAWVKVKSGVTIRLDALQYQSSSSGQTVSLLNQDGTTWKSTGNSWHKITFSYNALARVRSYVKMAVYVAKSDQNPAVNNLENNLTFYIDGLSMVPDTTMPILSAESNLCTKTYTTDYITNQSVETALSPWNNAYNTNSLVKIDSSNFGSACDGSYSIRVLNSLSGAATMGFQNVAPYASVGGNAGPFVLKLWAKTPYGNSVKISLIERTPNGTTNLQTVNSTSSNAVSTAWRQITSNPITVTPGNVIFIRVSSPNPDITDWMYVDKLSLIPS